MSLMKTLAKMAIGIAVAKGAKSMMGGGRSGSSGGGLLGGLLGGGQSQPDRDTPRTASSGTGTMLDSLFGGGSRSGGGGGLGGMLEQLSNKSNPSGDAQQGGGMDFATDESDLKGKLPSDLQSKLEQKRAREGSFGEVLNSQFGDAPAKQPTADQEAVAALMIRAMTQAAKSDGQLDAGERETLTKQLEDADEAERRFVQDELNKPVDVDGLVRDVPRGLEQQVYTMSLLGIDLDTNTEAQYLHQLAEGLSLSRGQVNGIHDEMGVQRLYR